MRSTIPEEFVRRIPKTDLHLHLDGSLRIPTLIELARVAVDPAHNKPRSNLPLRQNLDRKGGGRYHKTHFAKEFI